MVLGRHERVTTYMVGFCWVAEPANEGRVRRCNVYYFRVPAKMEAFVEWHLSAVPHAEGQFFFFGCKP